MELIEFVSAEVTTIALFVAGMIVSALGTYLTRERPKATILDDKPSTTSIRGGHLQVVLGIKRIGAYVTWVGDRKTEGNDILESAMHTLCLGPPVTVAENNSNPQTGLRKIWRSGREIFQGFISPATHPSGSQVTTVDGDNFRIYWGESDQPADSLFNVQIFGEDEGVRFPYTFRIHWIDFKLTAERWDSLDYEVEVRPNGVLAHTSPSWHEETQRLGETGLILFWQSGSPGQGFIEIWQCEVVGKDKVACPARFNQGGLDHKFGRQFEVDVGLSIVIKGATTGNGTYTVSRTEWQPTTRRTDATLPNVYIGIQKIWIKENFNITGTFSVPTCDVFVGNDDAGANPAHMIDQLLFRPGPHGINERTEDYGTDSLIALGELLKFNGGEGLAAHILIQDGKTLLTVLGHIMTDVGLMMPLDPVTEKIEFIPIRKPAPSGHPHIPEALLMKPLPEISTVHDSPDRADNFVYAYRDQFHRHRDRTITVDDSGRVQVLQRKNARRIPIVLAGSLAVAGSIANRRQQEDSGIQGGYRIWANRSVRRLKPGVPITVYDIPDVIRIDAIQNDMIRGRTLLECVLDGYGVAASVQDHPGAGGKLKEGFPVSDLYVGLFELPRHVSGNRNLVWMLRVRSEKRVGSVGVWLRSIHPGETPPASVVPSEYQRLKTLTGAHVTGTLLSELSVNDPWEDAVGPTFTLEGPDADQVLDLSSSDRAWREGRQLLILGTPPNEEICFLQGITATGSPGVYQLDGILRAMFATSKATHSAGTRLWICPLTADFLSDDQLVSRGAKISVLSSPIAHGVEAPLGDSESDVQLDITGRGTAVLPVVNLKTVNGLNNYDPNHDADFRWSYHRGDALTNNTGAGYQGAGTPTIDDPGPEGRFRITVKTTGGAEKRVVYATTNSWTYSNEDMRSDFTGEPDAFDLEVVQELAGFESSASVIRVDKSDEVVDPPLVVTPEHSKRLDFEDDMLYGNTIWQTSTGGGGAVAQAIGTVQHPGVTRLSLGGTFGDYATLHTSLQSLLVEKGYVYQAFVAFPNALIGTGSGEAAWIGLGNNPFGGIQLNGIYFRYDESISLNWLCYTAANTVQSAFDSGVAVAGGGTYFDLRIEVVEEFDKGAPTTPILTVRFWINGLFVGKIRTNIPVLVSEEVFPLFMIADLVGNTVNFDLDVDATYLTNELLGRG